MALVANAWSYAVPQSFEPRITVTLGRLRSRGDGKRMAAETTPPSPPPHFEELKASRLHGPHEAADLLRVSFVQRPNDPGRAESER